MAHRLILVALAALLCGCKVDMTAEVRTSDLRLALDGQKGLTAAATLSRKIADVEECAETSSQMLDLLSPLTPDLTAKGCHEDGRYSYIVAETSVPIVAAGEGDVDSLFAVFVTSMPNGRDVGVALATHKGHLKSISDSIWRDYRMVATALWWRSRLSLAVNNDEAGAARLSVQDRFVNSTPVASRKEFSVQPGQRIVVRLSDVATDDLEDGGIVGAFTLRGFEGGD